MNSEVEKYVKKQNQLQEQIEELFAEKKILQDKISILNECLSFEKIERKISVLENKQKILTNLESMVSSLRNEIKPLDYLKQLLERQLMISTLPSDDLKIEDRKYSESSQLTVNSGCGIETLDSVSDVSSEDSIMVLSDYDVLSDEEVLNDTENSVPNKVMYDEALQMASSMHLSFVGSSISNIESMGSFPIVNDQMKESTCVQSNSNDTDHPMMSASVKSEQLLEMYDVVNEQDLLNNSGENDQIELERDAKKVESILQNINQSCIFDEGTGNIERNSLNIQERENMLKSLNVSWVEVDANDSFDISIKSEQINDVFQGTVESQKDSILSKENIETHEQNNQLPSSLKCETGATSTKSSTIDSNIIGKHDVKKENAETGTPRVQYDEICDQQFPIKPSDQPEEKSEVKSVENTRNIENRYENEIDNPVCSTNVSVNKVQIVSLSSNHGNSSFLQESDEQIINVETKTLIQNDRLSSDHQFNTKENHGIKSVEKFCNDVEYHHENDNPVSSTDVLDDKVQIVSLSSNAEDSSFLSDHNEPKINLVTKTTRVQNNQLIMDHRVESKNISEIQSFEDVCKNVKRNYENKIDNPVCSTSISEDTVQSKPLSSNSEGAGITKNKDDLFANAANITLLSSNDEKCVKSCRTDKCTMAELNVELINGIRHHGFENLMTLQQQFIFHCINGRDIIFHSYPCVGKSTMALISVLQRIDTGFNECQAIVLVPTLELALFAQKMVKSFGKFLNVSTCIGGANVPRKVSPVPHVVISTPRDLCNMINCNSLNKDFIKMLVIDDADDMFRCNGFSNDIRRILLFLNNKSQLVILSTSKLEDILDQFSEIMRNPEYIILADERPFLGDIAHYYFYVPEEWKFDAFCDLYKALNLKYAVTYCNTWSKSLVLAENMRLKTRNTVSTVHKDMDTSQRRLILRQFRSAISRMLITTELLRGEYFPDVLWVVNYDLPKNPECYVRRVVGCFDRRRVKVINFIGMDETIAKENIETTFNFLMLNIPENVTDLRTSNLESSYDPIFDLFEF